MQKEFVILLFVFIIGYIYAKTYNKKNTNKLIAGDRIELS